MRAQRLDSVCLITMGQAPPGDSYNTDGHGYPLIAGAGDFSKGEIASKKFTTAPGKISDEGDVILGIRASIGDKVLSDGRYCLGRGVAGLRPLKGLDRRYLWQWLGFIKRELAAKGRGATFLQVNRNDIGEMEIPLPSLGEQKRIAAVLDQVDTLRAKRQEAIALLDTLAQSLFLDMFGTGDRHPVVPLGEQLSFITSGGRGWAKYYSDSGSIFIRSLDVQMNSIEIGEVAYVQAPDNAEARRTRVESGDVLLTITGSRIGRVSAVPENLSGAYVSQHVAILRPVQEKILPDFLAFYLSIPSGGQRQISNMQYGQTKPGLNFRQIEEFMVPLPGIPLQREFIARVSQVRKLRASHARHLTTLDELFTSLQHRAFSGTLWDHEAIGEAA
ncbi:restriction endonuclease subunit S [Streptomyces sp. NPDC004250]|uniref:restriction endonuclease subunit S n=1 Tax=Streptomyces sp. NPDC004250 TaxID=3364692 RepID=UPI0036B5437F